MTIKVFIVDYKHEADYCVYLTDYSHDEKNELIIAGGKLVKYKHDAHFKIYIVKYKHDADIIITPKNFPR